MKSGHGSQLLYFSLVIPTEILRREMAIGTVGTQTDDHQSCCTKGDDEIEDIDGRGRRAVDQRVDVVSTNITILRRIQLIREI